MDWGALGDAFDTIKRTFKEYDWLANAIQIGTPILAIGILLRKRIKLLFKPSSFGAVAANTIAPRWTQESARELADIAIVDDNPADFPVAELRRASYKVRTFKSVGIDDIPDLLNFDVVFLDIHGIVKDDIESGGLKVIAQLRAGNPLQKICAVSNRTFDPTATSFFKQADDVQKKPMTAQKCGELINVLAREKLAPPALASQLDEAVRNSSVWARRKAVAEVCKFASSDKNPTEFSGLSEFAPTVDLRVRLAAIDFIRVLRHATT